MRFVKKVFVIALVVLTFASSTFASAAWYSPYMWWGENTGIIQKQTEPNAGTTRGEALRMLMAYETKMNNAEFTGEQARLWAMHNKISDGERMDSLLTRAEAVTLLARDVGANAFLVELSYGDFLQTPIWAMGSVCWATTLGIVNGMEDGKFHPNATLENCQFVKMIYQTNKIYNPDR